MIQILVKFSQHLTLAGDNPIHRTTHFAWSHHIIIEKFYTKLFFTQSHETMAVLASCLYRFQDCLFAVLLPPTWSSHTSSIKVADGFEGTMMVDVLDQPKINCWSSLSHDTSARHILRTLLAQYSCCLQKAWCNSVRLSLKILIIWTLWGFTRFKDRGTDRSCFYSLQIIHITFRIISLCIIIFTR